jgi:AraC family transcriptional regulator
VELLHVQLSGAFLESVAAHQGWTSNRALEFLDQFLLQDTQVTHIAYALFAELHENGSSGRLYSESLATALATYMLRKYTADRLPAAALLEVSRHELKRALEYMHEHLAEDIALETLAQLVNLSPSHFNALFKTQIGVAPYRYILQQRINRAKELLLRSDFSIAQVAAEVGFYDQSHLTRHMRQILGVTPAALRHQQNVPNRR